MSVNETAFKTTKWSTKCHECVLLMIMGSAICLPNSMTTQEICVLFCFVLFVIVFKVYYNEKYKQDV